MMQVTPENVENAERAIIAKAQQIAYEKSDKISNREIQTLVYGMVKDHIILGARMMEEELMKQQVYHEHISSASKI